MSDHVYLTDLADVLRAAGLTVVEIAGWKTRGFNGGTRYGGPGLASQPKGGLCHHTAGPHQSQTSSNYPSLAVVRDGRPGLDGPLAQLGLGFDGTWYVVAAGHANHAGTVDDYRYSNSYSIGVEAENPGDGSPWPAEQYASYVKGCAALGRHYGFTWRGHKEAATPYGRKIDPTLDMDAFRAAVGGVKDGRASDGVLSLHDAGDAVTALQELLNAHGAHLDVDGVFGPATQAAVKARQKAIGVDDDGAWGPLSVAAEKRAEAGDTASRDESRPPVKAPPKPAPRPAAPTFPLPAGQAYAVDDGGPLTHSGIRGNDAATVKQIQRAVHVNPDGVFGPRTKAAVQTFQAAHHLTRDGQVGPATWSALFN